MRLFLEYDTGTESLTVLSDKLAAYYRDATILDRVHPHATSPMLVLFSVHSARREAGLRAALPAALTRAAHREHYSDTTWPGTHLVAVATGPRDHHHPDGPAGPSGRPGPHPRPTAGPGRASGPP